MKRWNRMLSLLVAVLMLCGTCFATAEIKPEMGTPENPEGIRLECAPDIEDAGLKEALAQCGDLAQLDLSPKTDVANDGEDPGDDGDEDESGDDDGDDGDDGDGDSGDGGDGGDGDFDDGGDDFYEDEEEEDGDDDGSGGAGDEYDDDDEEEEGDFIIEDGQLEDYRGPGGYVIIPDGVTDICPGAFIDRDDITGVTIPASVCYIGEDAFFNTGLTSVKILSTVIEIEDNPFLPAKPEFEIICNSQAIAWAKEYKCKYTVFGHTPVTDPAVKATYTHAGKTKGSHCSVCGEILQAQETIAKKKLPKNGYLLTKDATKTVDIGTELQIVLDEQTAKNYKSDNSKVAKVSKKGLVTALKGGTAKITVTPTSGKALTLTLKVNAAPKLSKTKLSLIIGKTADLKVNNLGKNKVTWATSDAKIATVKNGKVTAVTAGNCEVTAKLSNDKTLTCKVEVTDGATLSKTKLVLKVKATATLTIKNLANRTVKWSSTNRKVATVKNGKVTAVGKGSCDIIADITNGKKLTCKVTVKAK